MKDLTQIENEELKKIILTNERFNLDVSLADIIRYESIVGKTMGKDIKKNISQKIDKDKLIEILFALLDDYQLNYSLEIKVLFTEYPHILESSYNKDNFVFIKNFFLISELVFLDGTIESQDLIINIIEDFQSIVLNKKLDTNKFSIYFEPLVVKWWSCIELYWEEVSKYKKTHNNFSN